MTLQVKLGIEHGLCADGCLDGGVRGGGAGPAGIASAEVCPGAALAGPRGDFNEINNVIASLVDVVMEEIGEVSPWFALLDRIAGKTDKVLVNFSIDVARREARALAEEMAPLGALG